MKKGKEEAESTALCYIKETELQKIHDQIAHKCDPQEFEY